MKLKVEARNIIWKNVKKLRREWKVPATVYAKHMGKSLSIVCQRNEFVKLYKKAGHSTPITLIGDGIEEMVLIHNYQLDPVMDTVIHIDFLWIQKWVKVSAEVAILIEWEELSPIVKSGDAAIQLVKDYLAINAFPKDLPKEIIINVSKIIDPLTVIFVRDLELPAGVEIEDDLDQAVVTVMDLKKSAAAEEAKDAAAEEAKEEAKDSVKEDSDKEETKKD